MKITQVDTLTESTVSHNPSIKKNPLLLNREIAHITHFSRAVFPPGELAPVHSHSDMTEVFFVLSGSGEILVNDRVIELTPGLCITVEPGEKHELRNVGTNNLILLYFGVET